MQATSPPEDPTGPSTMAMAAPDASFHPSAASAAVSA
eukprot:CAMPEP_0172553770 /NCGR_PEP_ID=MMETSP1067-20121228/51647_1 /TAXON_ID=265564 ORGANISM="Thalassiosira punctigera, Strain Tpunct2005C2" /NCGR_SAMPLE_ID=MMETSP1067 /ASSEMBLY_ACC=CAM_ASM_000444 /LENGTH=36 /DNA_ID= /DNA_START= /DNA_END= /DNA_ORIENTATION=